MADRSNRLAFETRAIHGGQHPDPTTGAVMVPIYPVGDGVSIVS